MDIDLNGLLGLLFKAGSTQDHWLLVVLLVVGMLAVWGLRRFSGWLSEKAPIGKPVFKFFTTDLGGFVLALSVGVLGAPINALLAGTKITGAIFLAGLKNGALMVAAYVGGKKTNLLSASKPAE